jgi:hypothetical protein
VRRLRFRYYLKVAMMWSFFCLGPLTADNEGNDYQGSED